MTLKTNAEYPVRSLAFVSFPHGGKFSVVLEDGTHLWLSLSTAQCALAMADMAGHVARRQIEQNGVPAPEVPLAG